MVAREFGIWGRGEPAYSPAKLCSYAELDSLAGRRNRSGIPRECKTSVSHLIFPAKRLAVPNTARPSLSGRLCESARPWIAPRTLIPADSCAAAHNEQKEIV